MTKSCTLHALALTGIIGCAALTLASASHAATAQGAFAVKSMGTATCQRFLHSRAKGDSEYVLFAGYLGGYLTAYNQLTHGTFDILPWQSVDTLMQMMASYCSKNSQTVLAVAVTNLVEVLARDRLAEPSEMVEASVGRQRAQVYKEALLRAQKRLAELGHYSRKPDGRFDTATQRALEKYQQKSGLPKTGLPDQATLFRLLLAKP